MLFPSFPVFLYPQIVFLHSLENRFHLIRPARTLQDSLMYEVWQKFGNLRSLPKFSTFYYALDHLSDTTVIFV